jgi:hypothetical protein
MPCTKFDHTGFGPESFGSAAPRNKGTVPAAFWCNEGDETVRRNGWVLKRFERNKGIVLSHHNQRWHADLRNHMQGARFPIVVGGIPIAACRCAAEECRERRSIMVATPSGLCWAALTNTSRATVQINDDLDALMRDLVRRLD